MFLDIAPYLLAEGGVLSNSARQDDIISLHVRRHSYQDVKTRKLVEDTSVFWSFCLLKPLVRFYL